MNSKLTLTLGGLLLVAVTLVGCGGSSGYRSPTSPSPMPSPTPTPGGSASLTVTITGQNGGSSFSPNPATIIAGQSVAYYNADSIVHHIVANNGAFDTGDIAPGATSAPIMMASTGVFNIHCAIHPTMVGTLNVTNSQGGY